VSLEEAVTLNGQAVIIIRGAQGTSENETDVLVTIQYSTYCTCFAVRYSTILQYSTE